VALAGVDPLLLQLLDQVGLRSADVAELLGVCRAIVAAEVADVEQSPTSAVPAVAFDELELLPTSTVDAIRRRGCVVVRGTFDRAEAEEWDDEIGRYLEANRFEAAFATRYPDAAAIGSRIWGVYWSRPQVLARQHVRMVTVRRFLNTLWSHDAAASGTWFDPYHDIGYPDRLRRRAPGATARGLAPHCDSPSSGGWRVAENRNVFAEVLAGHPERFDPWDATHRVGLGSDAPVACTAFRTFQGWTALSEMQPSDGVLHIAPVLATPAYCLLKGIAGELGVVGDPVAAPRRAGADQLLERALVPIPAVQPGDTVWWHGDLLHGVAPASNDVRWGNVMYIGSSPRCPRNDAYAPSMLDRLRRGASPLDFPAEDFEAPFAGRARVGDLDDVGRVQFGLDPVPVVIPASTQTPTPTSAATSTATSAATSAGGTARR
jgi:hypothetical protein